jgi:uroporphyrinogen decarboxylase
VQNKHRDETIPHYIDFPVKDRATWEPFKAALDPEHEDRYTQLPAAVERLKHVDAPIGVSGGSLVGVPRNIMGFERIAVLPYEDPDLFREIVDTFGHCITTALARTLPHIQVDFCMGWEDFCFNQGPVIPPAVFEEVAGPWIRRIADLLVNHGCCVYTTDTDGNIMPVIGTFLNNGLNTMFPVEVKGGSDPVAIREKYGKRVKLWGGVDKMALMKDKAAIDAELTRLLPYVEQGGFVPGVDHRVPSDVPLDNYKYYLDRKRELFRVGGEPKY